MKKVTQGTSTGRIHLLFLLLLLLFWSGGLSHQLWVDEHVWWSRSVIFMAALTMWLVVWLFEERKGT